VKQALHIFRKDVRFLRWELTALLVLMAIFVYGQVTRGLLYDSRGAILSYLLLSFWAFLCARLIQAEAFRGDRQFWVTRPYEWRSLLGAKLIFVVACIGVPLLVADAVILQVEGFSVASHSAGLLWSLLLITTSTLIAFCAFATLTSGLTQWMLGAIITVGVAYAIASAANERVWPGVEWIRDYGYVAIMFLVAVVVLLAQYKGRRTVVSIVVMAAGWLCSSLFINYSRSPWALELETRFSNPRVDLSGIRIAVQAPAERAAPRPNQIGLPQVMMLAIPIDISGLSEGLDLISDEVSITVKSDEEGIWRQGRQDSESSYLQRLPKGYRLLVRMDHSPFGKANGRPVDLTIRLYLTMLRDSASRIIRPGEGAVDVPGAGRCRGFTLERDSWIVCESPLRAPPNVLVVEFGGERRDRFFSGTSYSPFPADANSAIIPLGRYSHSGPRDYAPAKVTSLEPVAHFRRDLEIPNVYLKDYQVLSPFER
jgi:hypothetical protein